MKKTHGKTKKTHGKTKKSHDRNKCATLTENLKPKIVAGIDLMVHTGSPVLAICTKPKTI